MLSRADAQARVARGAAHLDKVRPGWERDIDVTVLRLSSCSRCVVGQLLAGGRGDGDEYHFSRACKALGLNSYNAPREHGFGLGGDDYTHGEVDDAEATVLFDVLQDCWIEAIARRLHPTVESARQPAMESAPASDAVSGTRGEPVAVHAR